MSLEHSSLDALRPQLLALPADALRSPNVSIEDFSHECERIRASALADAGQFTRIRYDVPGETERLAQAAAALREAERLWRIDAGVRREAEQVWLSHREEAYACRQEAFDYIGHCLRTAGTDDHARRLREIRKGTGHPDMIDDLGALAELAGELAAALDAIGYTADRIARLRELYLLLIPAYGTAAASRSEVSPARELRDRAFVYAKTQLENVRSAAKLAMRTDPERAARYSTTYGRSLRARSGAAAGNPVKTA